MLAVRGSVLQQLTRTRGLLKPTGQSLALRRRSSVWLGDIFKQGFDDVSQTLSRTYARNSPANQTLGGLDRVCSQGRKGLRGERLRKKQAINLITAVGNPILSLRLVRSRG